MPNYVKLDLVLAVDVFERFYRPCDMDNLQTGDVVNLKIILLDGGCGKVGGAVASYFRYLRFESSQKQFLVTALGIEKKKIKK